MSLGAPCSLVWKLSAFLLEGSAPSRSLPLAAALGVPVSTYGAEVSPSRMQDDWSEGPPVIRRAWTRAVQCGWGQTGSGQRLPRPWFVPSVLGTPRGSLWASWQGPSDQREPHPPRGPGAPATQSPLFCASTSQFLRLPLILPIASEGLNTSLGGLPPSPITTRLRGLSRQQPPLVSLFSLSWDGSPAQDAGLRMSQWDLEACHVSIGLLGTRF